jgi:crossover junction endodeoxyribonuclease RusA
MIFINEVLKLVSPIPPSVNHYLGVRGYISNGKVITTMYETTEAKIYKSEFKRHILDEVKKQNWNWQVNKTQHFYVDCVFYFDRIDKDSSNYDKCLLDAITETKKIWEDDNVALVRTQAVYYDSERPRIEIEIRPVDYIGIFNNNECYTNFIDRCSTCSRYLSGRCSILKKAIEGRVQSDITKQNEAFVCNTYKQKK